MVLTMDKYKTRKTETDTQFSFLDNEVIRGTLPVDPEAYIKLLSQSKVTKFSDVTDSDIHLFCELFFPKLLDQPEHISLKQPNIVNLQEEIPEWLIASIYYRINPPENPGTVESFVVPLVGDMLDVGKGILNIRQGLKIGSKLVSYVHQEDTLEAQIHGDGVVKVWNRPFCYLLGQKDEETAQYGRKILQMDPNALKSDGRRFSISNFRPNTIYFFSDQLLNMFLAPTDDLKIYLQNFLMFMQSPRLNGGDDKNSLVSLGTNVADLEFLVAKRLGILPNNETNRILLMYRSI